MSAFRKLAGSLLGSGAVQSLVVGLTGYLVGKYPQFAPIIAWVGTTISAIAPSPLLTKPGP